MKPTLLFFIQLQVLFVFCQTAGSYGPDESRPISLRSNEKPVIHLEIPEHTLWGFILYGAKQDSTILNHYLKLLVKAGCTKKTLTPGNYRSFQIDSNQNFGIVKSHGWLFERGFVYDYRNSFEELKNLTRTFISQRGIDRVDIILMNDKGEIFNEIR